MELDSGTVQPDETARRSYMPKAFVTLAACCLVFAAFVLTGALVAHAAEVIKSGNAQLTSDGMLKVEVKGLVLNDTTVPADVNGTADGVTEVVASLVCSR